MKLQVSVGVGLLGLVLFGFARAAFASESGSVTAIDILLEPDATMIRQAAANNARLRQVFPKSFALDDAHRPHITLVQRFVRTGDLPKVYTAAGRVLTEADVPAMTLRAVRYYYTPGGEVGVAGIVIEPTSELKALQQNLIAAIAPFTVETGTIGAFTARHDAPASDAMLIDYVATFVPKQAAEHFNPHVSTGVAPTAYLDAMSAEPFEPFTFSPASAAVYQLGPFGTAAKQLWVWP